MTFDEIFDLTAGVYIYIFLIFVGGLDFWCLVAWCLVAWLPGAWLPGTWLPGTWLLVAGDRGLAEVT